MYGNIGFFNGFFIFFGGKERQKNGLYSPQPKRLPKKGEGKGNNFFGVKESECECD
jgi:hypothetical protein